LVFSDPPYRLLAAEAVLRQLGDLGLLHEGATVVVEHSKEEQVPERVGHLAKVDERRFGDTVVGLYRAAPTGESSG
jgi:16S rRNA G966 N2-methylase RsmD